MKYALAYIFGGLICVLGIKFLFNAFIDYFAQFWDSHSTAGPIHSEHLALGNKIAKTKNINELLKISQKVEQFKDKWKNKEADLYAGRLKQMADNKGLKLTLTANLRSGVRRSGG